MGSVENKVILFIFGSTGRQRMLIRGVAKVLCLQTLLQWACDRVSENQAVISQSLCIP